MDRVHLTAWLNLNSSSNPGLDHYPVPDFILNTRLTGQHYFAWCADSQVLNPLPGRPRIARDFLLNLASIPCSRLSVDLLLMVPWDPLFCRLLFGDLQCLVENSRTLQFYILSLMAIPNAITTRTFNEDSHQEIVGSYSWFGPSLEIIDTWISKMIFSLRFLDLGKTSIPKYQFSQWTS